MKRREWILVPTGCFLGVSFGFFVLGHVGAIYGAEDYGKDNAGREDTADSPENLTPAQRANS